MLKHMLTQTPSLPSAAAAAPATAPKTTAAAAVSTSNAAPCGPNFKLATRANQQNSSSGQMLDTADAHLDVSTYIKWNEIFLFAHGVSFFFA